MPEYEFRYNIPPTADIVAIRDDEEGRAGSLMRWGLIAWWAKDGKKAPLLHNARAETITAKPIFTSSFFRRRCIIPATGFFEWKRLPDGRKQPFYISSMDGNPLSFAGIWDTARVDGIRVDSCAIITTDCNALMQPIHDRMPVILREDDWETWLNPDILSDKVLLPLLKPFEPDLMQLWAVSLRVGSVKNQGEELIQPTSLSGSTG
jgi:putative SOS response-associated peptidase YedK